jgi:pullulanase
MVSKFIVDSLVHWVKEYHIDGFRFDLMGVIDIETMHKAKEELEKIRPGIIIYGEGWTGGPSTIPDEERALKKNVIKMNGIGAFSDDSRDAIKGHVFYLKETGFVNGGQDFENDIRFSVTAGCKHSGVDYEKYTYSDEIWAKNPVDVVNYVSCHDNLTLWDKLSISCPDRSKEDRLAMNRLAAAIILTSQGIPFFLSGEEFARTKPIEGTDEVSENSYNLPHYTNVMRYDRLAEYKDLYEYYRGLIQLRKDHGLFRMGTTEEVEKSLTFVEGLPKNVVAYTLENEKEIIYVAYNANPKAVTLELPNKGKWKVCVEGDTAVADGVRAVCCCESREIEAKAISCIVAVQAK